MRSALAVLLALLLLPAVAMAAETTGSITGIVTGENTQPLQGVRVTVSSPALMGERTFTTDEGGKFTAPFLPPGAYLVQLTAPNMKPAQYTMQVGIGQTVPLNVAMAAGSGVVETVTVFGTTSKLESTTGGENFNYDTAINQLPVVNRQLEFVAQLAPNISFGPTPGTIAISGAPSFDTTVLLDGAEVSDPYFGSAPVIYMEEAIDEVQVLTTGVSAKYGRFQGGVINAVTKSGGNTFDGTVRVDLAKETWNQTTPFHESRSSDLQKTYTATVGGPIVKDRLWFFVGGRTIPTSATNNQTGFAGDPSLISDFSTSTNQDRYQGKLTGALTPNHTLNLSYLDYSQDTTNRAGLPAGDLRAATGKRSDPRNITTFEYQGILSANMFLNVQATQKRVEIKSGPADPSLGSPFLDFYGGGYQIWHDHWWDYDDASKRDNDTAAVSLTQVLSTANWGDHNLEYGIEYVNSKTGGENRQSATGYNLLNYDAVVANGNFFSDIDAGMGDPNNPLFNLISYYDTPYGLTYRWVALPLGGGQELKNTAAYVQDSWQYGKWRIDAGVRYEKYKGSGPDPTFNLDFDKFAPRLGVTYNLDQNWQLQATWGRYVSRFNDNVASAVTGVGGAPYVVQIYTGPTMCTQGTYCLTYDDVEAALRDDANWDITTTVTDPQQPTRYLADGINAPYADDLNLSVKRALPRNTGTFTLTYTNRKYRDLLTAYKGGQGTTTVTDPLGSGASFDLDTTIWDNAPNAKRDYEAVTATWEYRPNATWGIGGNWTFSTSQGNYEGEGRNTPASGSVIGFYPMSINQAAAVPYGYLNGDIRHRIETWANYAFDFGRSGNLVLGAIGQYQSGQPYSLTGSVGLANVPSYLNDSGSYTYFVDGRGNNRYNGFWNLDVSARYQVKMYKALNLWVQTYIRNITNEDQLVTFSTSGNLSETVPGSNVYMFNPGSSFGTARNDLDYQLPRTYNVSLGITF